MGELIPWALQLKQKLMWTLKDMMMIRLTISCLQEMDRNPVVCFKFYVRKFIELKLESELCSVIFSYDHTMWKLFFSNTLFYIMSFIK